jgi:hypothetical protein
MPTVHDFGNFKVYMFFRGHNPPHFLVRGPGFEAKVTIDEPRVLAGELPLGVFRAVRRWAIANRDLLDQRWNAYN